MKAVFGTALATLIAAPALAQTFPMKIPTPSGEVILPSEGDKRAYHT